MRCPSSRTWSRYQTGDLAFWKRRRLNHHLLGCRSCQSELAALLRIDTLLAATSNVPIPADMWSAVAGNLPSRTRHRRVLAGWRSWALAGAAVSLAGFWLWLQPAPHELPRSASGHNEFVRSHQLLSVHDPLADRAGAAALLAEETAP